MPPTVGAAGAARMNSPLAGCYSPTAGDCSYVDGVEVSTDISVGPDPIASAAELTIGCHKVSGNPGSVFSGILDEVAIYDHVLSSTEIAAHFAAAN
jgi:hypothetical protein